MRVRMDDLSRYMKERDLTRVGLAQQLGVTPSMLSHICSGRRQPGVALTKKIEALTGIPRENLRPDIFGDAQ